MLIHKDEQITKRQSHSYRGTIGRMTTMMRLLPLPVPAHLLLLAKAMMLRAAKAKMKLNLARRSRERSEPIRRLWPS